MASTEAMPLAAYGQFVKVEPAAAYFRGVEPGVRHVLTLTVNNTSMRGRRVRFVPPRSPAFTLRVDNDIELAPGLELRADLYFESDQAVDYHDQLMVLVGRSEGEMEQITVPVTALQPCARIELETSLTFGKVVHQTSVTRQLIVRNTGERPGTINFAPSAGANKFNVQPASGVVDAGKERRLKVEFAAEHLGRAEAELAVLVDGGSGPEVLRVGAEVVVQTLELRGEDGAPLTSLDLGPVYCGLRKAVKMHVINTGPTPVNFSMSKVVNADAAPVEGEDAAGPIFVSPLMGALAAGASMEISAIFAPPKAPWPAKGYVATAGEAESDEKFGREAHATQYGIEVLETGQKVTLGLRGRLAERGAVVVPPPATPAAWDARLGGLAAWRPGRPGRLCSPQRRAAAPQSAVAAWWCRRQLCAKATQLMPRPFEPTVAARPLRRASRHRAPPSTSGSARSTSGPSCRSPSPTTRRCPWP